MTPPVDAADPLTGRTFRVAAIDGVPTLEVPIADLTFGPDGRISGCATVNRLMGTATVEDGVLRCGPLAGTLMAGPPEAMEQEARLHRALSQPLRVVARDDGGVDLRADDGGGLQLVPDEAAGLV